jgi:hypothetical protein
MQLFACCKLSEQVFLFIYGVTCTAAILAVKYPEHQYNQGNNRLETGDKSGTTLCDDEEPAGCRWYRAVKNPEYK